MVVVVEVHLQCVEMQKWTNLKLFSSSNRWFGRGCGAGCDDLRRLFSWSLVQGEGAVGGLWSWRGGRRLDHLVDQLVVVVIVVVVHLVDQLVAGVLQVVVQLDTLVGTHLVCKMIQVDQIYVKMISKYAGWVSDSVRICNVGVAMQTNNCGVLVACVVRPRSPD